MSRYIVEVLHQANEDIWNENVYSGDDPKEAIKGDNKMTKWERLLLELITKAEKFIPAGYELEMEHVVENDDEDLDGWYVYKYDGNQATPLEIDEYDKVPLISDESVKRFHIDTDKVFKRARCYVCG